MASLNIETPKLVDRRIQDFKRILETKDAQRICDRLLELGVKDPAEEDDKVCCTVQDLEAAGGVWVHQNHKAYNTTISGYLSALPPKVLNAVRTALQDRGDMGDAEAELLFEKFIPYPKSSWIS